MRSVTVRLDDLRTMILNLGFVGENEHRKFNFDCRKLLGEYPSASVSLTVQPPAGDCYPATVERNGDLVSWTVTDSDLIEEGCGEIQLTFMVGEVVAKTCIGRTKVERSLGATGDIPTPIENWIEQAEEVISEAEAATAAAEGAAEHQPIIDDNGYWAVWDADAEEYVATEYKAQGTDGHDGVGIVSIEKTGTSGLVDTYTITFTSGNPVTYTVTNGRDADPTEIIDDNAGSGDTDKVWSADKSHELLTEIAQLVDDGKTILSGDFANGTLVNGDLYVGTYTFRVSSVNVIKYDRNITLTPDANYTFLINYFEPDGVTFKEYSQWYTTPLTIPANTYFKIVIYDLTILSGTADIDTYKNAIKVSTAVSDAISTIPKIVKSVSQIVSATSLDYQFLDNTAWVEGYYNIVNSAITEMTATSPWYRQKLEGLKPGTYYFNAFCSPEFTFFIDKTTGVISKASDLGVSQGASGFLTFANDFDAYISIYDSVTLNKNIAMFANGILPKAYILGWYSSGIYQNANGQKIYIVGNGYYQTIQSACDAATDGDIIFVRCGTYTEQVSIWTRKLHIIGEDKVNTILIDHSANYDTPPLEMAMGSLSNMTIIEDGSNPTVESSDSRYMMAYCLHIEHPDAEGETFEIDNCDFINETHTPLGCGLRANNTVRFHNCRFVNNNASEEQTKERGAFFVHAVDAENADNQNIIVENCIIESNAPRLAAFLGVPSGANNTGHMNIRFSNCCVWNANRGTANNAVTLDTTGGADVMRFVNSYGNTISVLNTTTE